MNKSVVDIINYINSIDRLGCKPFEFLSKDELKSNYNRFKLVEIHSREFEFMDYIKEYNPNPMKRINKKGKSNKEYWINQYSDVLKYPVVLGNNEVIDGNHRLCNIYYNNIKTFMAWVSI